MASDASRVGKGLVKGVADGAGDDAHATPPDPAAQIAGLIFALVVIDSEGHVTEANQAAETLFGRSSNRLIGRSFIELLKPMDPRIEQRLAEPDLALVAREISIRPAGKQILANVTISPVPKHKGWGVATIAPLTHADINLDERSSLPGAPSILAHEIKNPLAAIRGAGQLAARKLPQADQHLADIIVNEADRIARLIDRMQQLGRETCDGPIPCNAHIAIRNAVASIRQSNAKSIAIFEEFDPSLPRALINGDALEQVLLNLLANAVDAIRGDPQGAITVRTRFASGGVFTAIRLGRAVKVPIEITVSDNGPGVDPALRERIFDPFVSSKRSGQGLGLALVRKLMRDMNGSVGHERDEREGLTHFRLHLPLAPVATEQ